MKNGKMGICNTRIFMDIQTNTIKLTSVLCQFLNNKYIPEKKKKAISTLGKGQTWTRFFIFSILQIPERGIWSTLSWVRQKWPFPFAQEQVLKCLLLTWMSGQRAVSFRHPLLFLLQLSDHLWLIKLMPYSWGGNVSQKFTLETKTFLSELISNVFSVEGPLVLERGGFRGSKIKLPTSNSESQDFLLEEKEQKTKVSVYETD